jgi:DNA adenine methylase
VSVRSEVIQPPSFLRYPGGKRRMLPFLVDYVPAAQQIRGRYIEPFLGGGAVFLYLQPDRALLSDLNPELIHLYESIRDNWTAVWSAYLQLPADKDAYNEIRDWRIDELDSTISAARLLYLNRTCFKGMWRHNAKGKFNVGYGGEARRWVINEETLRSISFCLQNANLCLSDFQPIIESADDKDFIFLDPPYKPGAKEMIHDHYVARRFSFADHQRLAECLRDAAMRGVRWILTTSSHEDIVSLFTGFTTIAVTRGTGMGIGQTTGMPGEVLVRSGG